MKKMSYTDVEYLNKQSELTSEIIKKLSEKKISDLVQILKKNPYEQIIPFNLWFQHNKVTTKIIEQKGQLLRLRYYADHLLTPIRSDNSNMAAISKFIDKMTVYQPYYPESYYDVWELCHIYKISNLNDVLFVINENGHGILESVEMYREIINESTGKSDVWFANNEIFNSDTNTYNINVPTTRVLQQTYNFSYVDSVLKLSEYDYIFIDCLHKLDNLTIWYTEGYDIIHMLFYLVTTLKNLRAGGNIIVRLNMLGKRYWELVINIIEEFFSDVYFFRPTMTNPYNPIMYIYGKKYKKKADRLEVLHSEISYQFRHKSYTVLTFNYTFTKNKLLKRFTILLNEWYDKLNLLEKTNLILNPQYTIPNHITIGDLRKYSELEIFSRKSTASKSVLKNLTLVPKKDIADQLLELDVSYKMLLSKTAELNYTKRVMDSKPNELFMHGIQHHHRYIGFETWDKFSENFYPVPNIINTLRSNYNAQYVTNAWMKLFEICNYYYKGLFTHYTEVNAMHLCEAPGAFISASNHFFSTNNIKYNWHAQTLDQSVDKLALEDRFGLIKKYPSKWLFGPPDSKNMGDITRSENIRFYAKYFDRKINFMTGDGGFYCRPNLLNSQEKHVAKIIFGEIIAMLACLQLNGNGIIKMFLPMSAPLTVSMVYLLHRYFTDVIYTKPISSGASNSEIYLVLHKFKGIKEIELETLYTMLDDEKITADTFITDFSNGYVQEYSRQMIELIDRQIKYLHNMYYYYYHPEEKIVPFTYNTSNWFSDNNIEPLDESNRL